MDARELIKKEQQRRTEEINRQRIERERRQKLDEAFSRKFSSEARATHKKAKKEARRRELLEMKLDLMDKILRENYPELYRQDMVNKMQEEQKGIEEELNKKAGDDDKPENE